MTENIQRKKRKYEQTHHKQNLIWEKEDGIFGSNEKKKYRTEERILQ